MKDRLLLVWKHLLNAGREFLADDALTNAAAIAFYTALSFAPLLILLLWVASGLGKGFQNQIVDQATALLGPNAGEAVNLIIDNASQTPALGSIAGIFSVASLIFSATGVFGQLQKAMNKIWDVQAAPGRGLINYLRVRVLSLGMMVAVGFLLLTSLVVSTVLAAVLGSSAVQMLETIVSLVLFTAVFAAMFKFVPDIEIPWRVTWLGAILTSTLFIAGKFGIGTYLGVSSVGSAYGAAGSLLVLLVWVYYSSLIVFFGAELTQQVAVAMKTDIQPSRHAQWIDDHRNTRSGGGEP